MTLTEFCREVKNWFEVDKHFGEFTISDGSINLSSLQDGQYFRIVGSVFNDGVHQYPPDDLVDETFNGAIWFMAVPQTVITLIDEIDNWETENAGVINSPYQSESFGGYSYTKAQGYTSAGTQTTVSWQSTFANKLNPWRKV